MSNLRVLKLKDGSIEPGKCFRVVLNLRVSSRIYF